MVAPIQQLKKLKINAPICIGVHAVFANKAYEDLLYAGAKKFITCNTIQHTSNHIDLAEIITQSLKEIYS